MNVSICVGSSCHLKGSYDIIQLMRDAITEYQLDDKINLSAAFCLGRCTDGVSVKIDGEVVCGISKSNFRDFFIQEILNRLS